MQPATAAGICDHTISRQGDVIWCPPNVKHWHGATARTAVSHIAIQEALNGKVVELMEKVTDEQYLAHTPSQSD